MALVTPGVTPASVTGRGRERGCDDSDDRGGPPVGEGRERVRYRFGFEENGPRAGFLLWAGLVPRGPNPFLFCFPSFLFSVFPFSFILIFSFEF
jgi:hypothetical protein